MILVGGAASLLEVAHDDFGDEDDDDPFFSPSPTKQSSTKSGRAKVGISTATECES
jgi:hypothetical protein